jgi:hypothetical protein
MSDLPDDWCPTGPHGRPDRNYPGTDIPIERPEPPDRVLPDPGREFAVVTYFVTPGTVRATLFPGLHIMSSYAPPGLTDPIVSSHLPLRISQPLEIWDGYNRMDTVAIGVSVYESGFQSLLPDVWPGMIQGALNEDVNNSAQFASAAPTDETIDKMQTTAEEGFHEMLGEMTCDECFKLIQSFREGGLEHWRFDGPQDSPSVRECWGENALCTLCGFGYGERYSHCLDSETGAGVWVYPAEDGMFDEEVLDEHTGRHVPARQAVPPGDARAEETLLHSGDGTLIVTSRHHNWHHYAVQSVQIKEEAILQAKRPMTVLP